MKADNLAIAKVFSSGGDIHYVLPHFQREYTWNEEQWATLLTDVVATYVDMQPEQVGAPERMVEHFLGSIVVVHDGMRSGTVGAFKLVDGQQRLTTISLLLLALATLLRPEQPALSKKIERLLLNADEIGDVRYKILPTVKYGDRSAYCALMDGKPVPVCTSRIPLAYQYFERELAARLKGGVNAEKLLQVLINSLQVVFINLDQAESPYRIFESLNAKGKPLTQADLVRNYVAMRLPASHQERVFTESWSKVEELLQETRYVGRLTELTAFLRHYLAMVTGHLCEEQHVYARFRDRAEREFHDAPKFEAELRAIARAAGFYDLLLRPERLADKTLAEGILRLNLLESISAYPFLLRVLILEADGKLAREQVLETVTTLENYMVRRYLVGETPSYLNRMFPLLWNATRTEDFVGSLRTALGQRNYPSDGRLLRALYSRRLYDKNESTRRRTTLVLESINRRLSDGTGGYTVLDATSTIEHIMPQTLDAEWKDSLGLMWETVHRENLHALGNLTLVTAGWNSELSNAVFTVKRPRLAENALKLNSGYFTPELQKWGRDEIRERAEILGETILSLWPSYIDAKETGAEQRELVHAVSEFHFEVLERIAIKLGVPFRKLSQSRFESQDGKIRLVGLCSKPYSRRYGGDSHAYWYGVRPTQREFLEWAGLSWIAFECAPAGRAVLVPYQDFQPWLRGLRETEGQHWHVDLIGNADRLELPLPLNGQRIDVTPYRV
jgi:uncharacterized protein with ParB-like and HNH nuclease domain